MKKLDLYIIRKFLATFFFILGTIMLIAVIFDVSEKIDDFLETKPSLMAILVDYYLNFVLYFGNLFSPLLIFIAVIFFTSKMASNTEIVAILSAGVSFRRLLMPYMIAATLLAGISFYLNNWLIPDANTQRVEFENTYLRHAFRNVNRNIHKQIQPNEFLYFESFNVDKMIGYKISLERWENGKLKKKVLGDFARWDSTDQLWTIQNYLVREYREDGTEKLRKGNKMDTVIGITPKEFTERKYVSIQMMDYSELNAFIEEEKMKGSDEVAFYEIEKHQRTSLPFATYVLTVIGVSVSSKRARGGIGAHLALGLLLAVSYILFMKISTVFATNAGIDPLIATWFPNILFGVIALVLLRFAPK